MRVHLTRHAVDRYQEKAENTLTKGQLKARIRKSLMCAMGQGVRLKNKSVRVHVDEMTAVCKPDLMGWVVVTMIRR